MPSYRMASRCARAEWRVASRLRRRPRSLRRRARFRQRNMARGRRRSDAARRRLGRHARRARGAARHAHVAGAVGGVCGVRDAAQIPVRWGQRCADGACRLGSHRGRRGRAVTAAGAAQRAASSVHRVVRLQVRRASCCWPGATRPLSSVAGSHRAKVCARICRCARLCIAACLRQERTARLALGVRVPHCHDVGADAGAGAPRPTSLRSQVT